MKIRSMKNYNKEDFQQALLDSDWSCVMTSDNVSEAWNCFKSKFMSIINNIAPVKECRIKQRTQPWMTSDILNCIKERDSAFHIFKKHKSECNFNSFKEIRNKTQYLVLKDKQNYFKEKLEENKNQSKSLWNTLKQLGLPSKKGNVSASKIGLKIDGDICFDNLSVAEKFNSFYTNVASKLVEKLPICSNLFGRDFVLNYYATKGVIPNNFSFSLVYENKILNYLNKLSANKATGLDGIPSRFVRDSASCIACPLTHIVNLSIIQGSVPDDLKSARVIPLYKKNDKTEVGNYRPVSIHSIISKIFERVIYDQVVDYLDDKKLLYSFQSGFRRGFSTETYLIHLSDYIRFNMDKGNLIGMVLLDLQNAFDRSIMAYCL